MAQAYEKWRHLLFAQSQIRQALEHTAIVVPSDESPNARFIECAINDLLAIHDERHGGLGRVPKFSHPDNLALLFVHEAREKAWCVFPSIGNMALGDIRDVIGAFLS